MHSVFRVLTTVHLLLFHPVCYAVRSPVGGEGRWSLPPMTCHEGKAGASEKEKLGNPCTKQHLPPVPPGKA